MGDPEFGERIGETKIDGSEVLTAAMGSVNQVLAPSDTQLLLRSLYESTYGIYDHDQDDPERPLALMGFHTAEDSTTDSLLHERIRAFGLKNVTKYFGCSLNEFFDLPTDICMMMMETCEELKKMEHQAASAAEAAINNLGAKG